MERGRKTPHQHWLTLTQSPEEFSFTLAVGSAVGSLLRLGLVLKQCYHAMVCASCSAQRVSCISRRSYRHLHRVAFQPLWLCRGIHALNASLGASQRALPSSCNSSFLLLTGVSAESLPGAVWQRLSWERRDYFWSSASFPQDFI